MRALIAAEGLKLRTTRLLWALIPGAIAPSIAAVLGAVLSADGAGVDLETSAGVNRALHVTGTGSILVLALGIIMSAGEYRTQTATDTFLTTPKRHHVTAAKLAVGAGVGIAFGILSATAALATSHLAYAIEGVTFPIEDTEVWFTLAGAVVYAGLFAVLGVAVGGLIRNQVVAIVASFAWILVIENIAISLSSAVSQWLPGAAGQAIVRTPDRDLLPPAAATVVLAGYGIIIAAIGIAAATRRDA